MTYHSKIMQDKETTATPIFVEDNTKIKEYAKKHGLANRKMALNKILTKLK